MGEMIMMDDAMVCAEMIFVDGDIPFERYFFGSVDELSEILSDTYLASEALKKNAKKAYVQNIYFRSKTLDGAWRSEFRVGIQGEVDIESFISKEND